MWINKEYFYTNLFLKDLGFLNFVTTKKAGDIKKNKLRNIFVGKQIHSDNFYEITQKSSIIKDMNLADFGRRELEIIENNDGFFTKKQDIWMGIFTADCMPIFVVSENPKIASVLHSGWKGVELDITGKLIDRFISKFGVKISDIFVVIGPHINREYYEVNVSFQKKFVIDEIIQNGEKKYFLDLQKNLKNRLLKKGFIEKNIKTTNLCTVGNNKDFFSYRMDNKTEARMLSGLRID